jgi:L-asparagine transporter-like permease
MRVVVNRIFSGLRCSFRITIFPFQGIESMDVAADESATTEKSTQNQLN